MVSDGRPGLGLTGTPLLRVSGASKSFPGVRALDDVHLDLRHGEVHAVVGAMVVHDQTSVTGVQRRDGFVDYLKKNEPNITIADIQYSGDPRKATDLAKAIIAANPTSRVSTAPTRVPPSASSTRCKNWASRASSRSSASTPARIRSTRSRVA